MSASVPAVTSCQSQLPVGAEDSSIPTGTATSTLESRGFFGCDMNIVANEAKKSKV